MKDVIEGAPLGYNFHEDSFGIYMVFDSEVSYDNSPLVEFIRYRLYYIITKMYTLGADNNTLTKKNDATFETVHVQNFVDLFHHYKEFFDESNETNYSFVLIVENIMRFFKKYFLLNVRFMSAFISVEEQIAVNEFKVLRTKRQRTTSTTSPFPYLDKIGESDQKYCDEADLIMHLLKKTLPEIFLSPMPGLKQNEFNIETMLYKSENFVYDTNETGKLDFKLYCNLMNTSYYALGKSGSTEWLNSYKKTLFFESNKNKIQQILINFQIKIKERFREGNEKISVYPANETSVMFAKVFGATGLEFINNSETPQTFVQEIEPTSTSVSSFVATMNIEKINYVF